MSLDGRSFLRLINNTLVQNIQHTHLWPVVERVCEVAVRSSWGVTVVGSNSGRLLLFLCFFTGFGLLASPQALAENYYHPLSYLVGENYTVSYQSSDANGRAVIHEKVLCPSSWQGGTQYEINESFYGVTSAKLDEGQITEEWPPTTRSYVVSQTGDALWTSGPAFPAQNSPIRDVTVGQISSPVVHFYTMRCSYLHCGRANYCSFVVGHITAINIPDPNVSSVKTLPPLSSQNSCSVSTHSSVNIDNLSLNESIPLVGVPFSLSYNSERFRKGSAFNPVTLGLGGWSPDVVHHYDVTSQIVYYGHGGSRVIAAKKTTMGFQLADESGSEVYEFDLNGVHLQTRDSLSGVAKFEFSYDSSGRLLQIKDSFGNTSQFDYSNAQIQLVSPYGQASTFTLDANGFLSSVTNPKGESYFVTADSLGQMTSFQKPGGQKSFVTYDEDGFVVKDQGAGGDSTSFLRQFDLTNMTQTVSSTSTLNRKTVYATSASKSEDATRSVLTPDGRLATFESHEKGTNSSSDSLGQLSYSSQASDPRFGWMAPYVRESSFQNPAANINLNIQSSKTASLSDPNDPFSFKILTARSVLQNDPARVFESTFDSASRSFVSTSPMGRKTSLTLNEFGLFSSTSLGGLNATQFFYDARGRLLAAQQSNRKTALTYDSHGNMATYANPFGKITTFKYDEANRLIQRIRPDGKSILFTYDANGNLTSVTTSEKNTHLLTYNIMELAESYLPPAINAKLFGSTHYNYNLDQQLTQVTRSDGTRIDFNYDATTGLLQSILSGDGSSNFIYYPKSDLVKTLTAANGESLSFQYAGRLPLVIQNAGQIQSEIRYGYNLDGSLKTVSVQDGRGTVSQIETTYDNDGLIKSTGELQFDRNDFGAITKSSLQRVQQVSGYNGFGEKTSDKFYDISKTLAEYSYTRDSAGRINTIKESRNGVLRETYFRYDLEGRVQQVFPPRGVAPRGYSYDANGNRLSAKTVKGLVTADYDSQDRLVRYGQTVFSYSENGNLIEKIEAPRPGNWGGLNWSDAERRSQKVTSYSYDTFNNLVSVTLPNLNKIDYVYDGLRRRIGKKLNGQLIRSYVYNGPTQIVAQLNGEGKIIQRYVYGEKSNVPDLLTFSGKEYRVISDHVGSPRLVVDVSTGKVEQEIEFDEFGVIVSRKSYELPFGFAGGLFDQDTNLVHFGARDYDPEVGRWITKDPIGFGGGDTNLYGYVAGDPVNFVDPDGLYRCTYSISSHTMNCSSSSGNPAFNSSNFVAGNGVNQNNPAATTVPNSGPLPIGTYNVGAQRSSSSRRALSAASGTDLGGRSSFQTHGCSDPSTCSNGCIGATTNRTRDELNRIFRLEEGNNTIRVVP